MTGFMRVKFFKKFFKKVLTWCFRHAIIKLTKAKTPKQKGGNSGAGNFLEGTSDDKGNQKAISGGGLQSSVRSVPELPLEEQKGGKGHD